MPDPKKDLRIAFGFIACGGVLTIGSLVLLLLIFGR